MFLGAAAFALATVLLSCARPGRIAGRVSPVEAVRYTEAQQTGQKGAGFRRVTPFSMAMANLGRSRKKTVLVVASLSLAVALLYTLGSGLLSGLLSAVVNPLAGRLLENAYWFYRYHDTITPVLLLVPVFALLGYAIPAVMYRQAERQSVVERLREADA